MILGHSLEDGIGVGGPDEGFGVGVAFVEVGQGRSHTIPRSAVIFGQENGTGTI